MAITNKQKRQLSCHFCPKKGLRNCNCNKFWKEIYRAHRDEILEIYHNRPDEIPDIYRNTRPPQPQVAKEGSNSS